MTDEVKKRLLDALRAYGALQTTDLGPVRNIGATG